MMKKVIAVLVVVLLFAGFAGCSKNLETSDTVSDVTDEGETSEEVGETSEEVGETSEESTDDSSTKTILVGYSDRLASDEFMKMMHDSFEALADADDTIEVMFADADSDSQKQIEQLDNFFVSEVDVLVLLPNDGDSLVPQIKQANEAGIPVICLSLAANDGDFTFVGVSDYQCGYLQGKYCYDNLPENAKVLYLGGNSIYQISIDRKDGFLDGLGDRLSDNGGDVEILSYQECMYTMDDGMTIMEDWIQTFEDFDAVVAVNDLSALGAIQAMKAANVIEGKIVCGIDAISDAKQAVSNGEMTMTVMQDAKAQAQAVYDCIKILQSGGTSEKRVDTELIEITSDNVADYLN